MWTKHSGNFWTLTTHNPLRTLHKILYQSPVLERSMWTQIILTSVHLLFLKWSSWEVWCWPFAWNVSSSSDCPTKTQRHLVLHHSPNNHFPNFSVCSSWVCFQLSREAAPWPHPLLRIPLGSQGGQGTESRKAHQERLFPFTWHRHLHKCGHIVWEVGPKGTILLQHVLWYFGNYGSH